MTNRFYRAVAVVATSVMGSLWFAAATQAATLSSDSRQSSSQAKAVAAGARYAKEVKLLDPYVSVNADGTLTLAAPASVLQKVDSTHLQTLENGLAGVNQKILAGELKTTAAHKVYDPTNTGFSVQWNWTGRQWNWWGMSYWFSEYWTWKIEGVATIGAGVTGLCAVIAGALGAAPIVLLCGVAAAILTIGVGWMMVADNGGGVVFNETWTPFPFGAIWIWGQ